MPKPLKIEPVGDRQLVITRDFDAPRDLVFLCFSKPELMRRWYGLPDWTMTVCEIDFRVGGKWRFINAHPSGEAEFYGEYQEIDAPGRIVFTEIFAPFPDAPSVVTSVLTEENGKTRMTATCAYMSKEVRDMVMSTGMERGAALSYDRLEDLIAELQQS
jgi:uncharacterized protein YndB with AHSA1/START domain